MASTVSLRADQPALPGTEVLSHIKPDSFHNSVAGSRSEEEWAYLIVEGASPRIQREEERERERGLIS